MSKTLWKDEKILLIAVISAFILLCIAEAKLPVFSFLQGTWFEVVLTSGGFKNIFTGLIVSFIAAYIFYIFIDVLPRYKKHRDTTIVLNALMCSILDSYNRCRVFGHETALPYVDTSVFAEDWLEDTREKLKQSQSTYLPLLFAMQTAHTRQDAFHHSLVLASGISPKHSMQWLVIIDKVRLLAENYGNNPDVPMEQTRLVDSDSDENPVKVFRVHLTSGF
ncbi:hypothetical protein [Photobacterium leiognathi]|uniref:hypothetical protein n=1 Tax=Photobacterium leiognathi TaxID=553611 RepID=UPI002739D83E|nr:hypothetical protein [Photobacterium leiognathi]